MGRTERQNRIIEGPFRKELLETLPLENWLDRVLIWIPFSGWIIGKIRWHIQFDPLYSLIDRTLRARQSRGIGITSDGEHRDLRAHLKSLIKDFVGWSSDCFIDEDSCDVLLWDPYDALVVDHIVLVLQDKFPDKKAELEHVLDLTFGQLVDLLSQSKYADQLES